MEVIQSIRPSFFRVGLTYFWGAMFSLASAAVVGSLGGSFLAVLVCAAIFFIYPIFRHIERNQRVYTLTDSGIEIRYGILRQTIRTIPLRSI